MKRALILTLTLLFLALPLGALCEDSQDSFEIGALAPVELSAQEEALVADLYCGPTQGFFRHDALSVDTGAPFVYFGQYDCWAMVASGTLEDMGPIGWVESAAFLAPENPQLAFEDALTVMVEDDTFLTDEPLAASPARLCDIARGTQVILLAQYEGWGYVQGEIEGTPVRAFLPLSAIL